MLLLTNIKRAVDTLQMKVVFALHNISREGNVCLLYTSDAADDRAIV